jgi:formiminotetrahydrofolate cyclodeaminase
MIDQPFRKLIEDLAAKTPTPGGGAAAAFAACLGTALFLMVVRFSRGKKQNVEREHDLAEVEALLDRYLLRMLPMAERDCNAFDLVSISYQMPKDTEEQTALRERAIEEAMIGAMVVPEETLCMVRDVCHAMAGVVDCVAKNIVSDLASGSALLRAAAEGTMLNVQINATYLKNRELADRTKTRARAVRQEVRDHAEAIARRVEQMIG